jgi:hypothetical protein
MLPRMSKRVFVSYSREDEAYVRHLVQHLSDRGVATWHDRSMDPGSRWEGTIQRAIDDCAAFVVVMTPASGASPWVARELLRALRRKKPIIPLLLDGEIFFNLLDIQVEDVTGDRMPSPWLITNLRRLTTDHPPAPPEGAISRPAEGRTQATRTAQPTTRFTARTRLGYLLIPLYLVLVARAASVGWQFVLYGSILLGLHLNRLYSLKTFYLILSGEGIEVGRRRRVWSIPWQEVVTIESGILQYSPVVLVRTARIADFPVLKPVRTIPPVYNPKTDTVVICHLGEIRQRWIEVNQALSTYAGSSWIGGPLPSRPAAFVALSLAMTSRMLRGRTGYRRR